MKYVIGIFLGLAGCATVPEPKFQRYAFPKGAFVGVPTRAYTALGPVRSKVDFPSLDPNHEEKKLCDNYYRKSVRELITFAKKQGADAVINVSSVVFLEDGRRETYKTPECSDEGGEGQILTQGIAVKWTNAPQAVNTAQSAPIRPIEPVRSADIEDDNHLDQLDIFSPIKKISPSAKANDLAP